MRFSIESEWRKACRECDKPISETEPCVSIDNDAFIAHYHLKCAKKIYADLGRIIAKIENKMKEGKNA